MDSNVVGMDKRLLDFETMLTEAGFEDVMIDPKDDSQEFIRDWSTEHALEEYIVSAIIEGKKPLEMAEVDYIGSIFQLMKRGNS